MRRVFLSLGLAAAGGVLLGMAAVSWAQEGEAQEGQPPGITAELEGSTQRAVVSVPEPGDGSAQPPGASGREQAEATLKKPVSVSFASANLRSVLSNLAKTYGLNIVAGESVQGTVNLTLKNVPLGEVLEQLLALNGYTIRWEGSIMKVVSREEEEATEVLSLKFLEPDTAIEFLSPSSSKEGVLKADELQNAVLVRDKISKVEEMKRILAEIDLPPQQVYIQARLLDITLTDLDNLGLSLSSVSFDIPLRANLAQSLLAFSSGSLNLPGSSSDLTTDTVSATIAKGSETLTATLDALIRHSRVKVLASPSVATLNNVEAKIIIGEKFPIKETTQTTTGTLQTTRFVDIGITLRVTPKINRSGYIQLQIHPEVSSVSATLDAGPRITTREADTTLIVKGGETVLIAGLIKEEETTIKDRIPILGHIPILGLVFQSRSKDYEQKELVIAITPHLLPVEPPQVVQESTLEAAWRRLDAAQIYYQAEDFERGRSLQARQALPEVRGLRAVELYEELATRFPEHPLAPKALWRAGELAWDRLQDADRSLRAFRRLISDYPSHRYSLQAQKRLRHIQAHLDRQARKRQPATSELASAGSEEERKAPQQNFGPFGFR